MTFETFDQNDEEPDLTNNKKMTNTNKKTKTMTNAFESKYKDNNKDKDKDIESTFKERS